MGALERWREALASWAIPDEILAKAPEPPWGFRPEIFADRARRAPEEPETPSRRRAGAALRGGGTVLDVGAGAGAASLPLAPPADAIVAVDPSRELLTAFEELAVEREVTLTTIERSWPEAAGESPVCDVVVCHHVLYNVPDLGPFVRALTDHARRLVVVELTAQHPVSWMADLWRRFHDLERPTEPTADVAVAALREAGIDTGREDHLVPREGGGFPDREAAVAQARRMLCLTPDRDPEVAEALGDRLREGPTGWGIGPPAARVVTLWWEP
ncbi:MAG TPA: class I SAM-dependent methyltransferase [Actinomycetota bacterium]